MAELRPGTVDQAAFLAELVEHGLLLDTGVPGLYGRSGEFEDVREGVAELVTRAVAPERPERMRFPPILPRRDLETVGYLKSFPHLAGSIFAFAGDERQAAEQYDRASRHEDWSEFQTMTDLVLTPAACYPVYPAIAARGGRRRHDRRRRRLRLSPRALGRPRADADLPPARDRPHRRAGRQSRRGASNGAIARSSFFAGSAWRSSSRSPPTRSSGAAGGCSPPASASRS